MPSKNSIITLTRHLSRTLLTVLVLSICGLGYSVSAPAETLNETLLSVYNKNPQLLAARARLREVDETYIQARSQGRFSIDASAQYSRSVLNGSSNSAQQNIGGTPAIAAADNEFYYAPSQGQVQIIQPLYQGGRIKALKTQAKSEILAQREILRATENQLFLATTNAYLDVQLAEETAHIRRNNVRVLGRQLMAAKERFEVGQGTRTDIAQSESRLAAAEAGLAQADANLQIARAGFQRLVGRMPINLQPTPFYATPKSVDEAMRLARENNPNLIAAYFIEEAGESAIDVAKAAGRPIVSLNGSIGAQRGQILGFQEAETAAITANVTIPIFSGGMNKSRVRQAKHAKTRLSFETRDREREVDELVIQAWARRQAAEASLAASTKQVRSAEVALEGVTLEHEVGTRTQLDVLDAEQELLNAKLALINAQRNLNASRFLLLSTIGVLDAEGIQLDVGSAYDPKDNLEAIQNDQYSRILDGAIIKPFEAIKSGTEEILADDPDHD